jgi:predicted O-methyltransferase YrrM
MDYHKEKLFNFVLPKIINKENLNILELGVREGKSTNMFIDLVEKNNGELISIDIDDYSTKFKSKNWKFIKSRDDNFEFILNQIQNKLDVIFIDTTHEANHVLNIIENYYLKLKQGGYIFIDDISWLPYLRNKETFEVILNLYNNNELNFDLEYSFVSSGFACLKKKNNNKLNSLKKIKTREYSLANFLRKIKNYFT